MTSLPFSVRIKKGRNVWRVIGILTVGADGIGVEWRSDEYRRKRFRRKLEHVGRGELEQDAVLDPHLVELEELDARGAAPEVTRGPALALADLDDRLAIDGDRE